MIYPWFTVKKISISVCKLVYTFCGTVQFTFSNNKSLKFAYYIFANIWRMGELNILRFSTIVNFRGLSLNAICFFVKKRDTGFPKKHNNRFNNRFKMSSSIIC